MLVVNLWTGQRQQQQGGLFDADWMMSVPRRVLISAVILLLLGALFIACGLGLVPYLVKEKLDAVSSTTSSILISFFTTYTHIYSAHAPRCMLLQFYLPEGLYGHTLLNWLSLYFVEKKGINYTMSQGKVATSDRRGGKICMMSMSLH